MRARTPSSGGGGTENGTYRNAGPNRWCAGTTTQSLHHRGVNGGSGGPRTPRWWVVAVYNAEWVKRTRTVLPMSWHSTGRHARNHSQLQHHIRKGAV